MSILKSFLCTSLVASFFASSWSDYVTEHNKFRASVHPTAANMLKMTWSDELAKIAQKWADGCHLNHNSLRSQQSSTFSYVGENIYWSTRNHTEEYVVDHWHQENTAYTYTNNTCAGRCGHYTQEIWSTSEYIGCGKAHCGKNYFTVCDYGPGGNYRGEIPYTTGTPCSKCPHGYHCEHKLCTKSSATHTTHAHTTHAPTTHAPTTTTHKPHHHHHG
ncbi:peptidase inhibitor 16-like [Ostrea edulis]|uniref:peptidase inhibitor 16-like n=1 Tax=Ostrea edulis TaxID=37623 RepID=UPI0024AFFF66|nr:peptidase inhibitor 16-like [Ostrea edulis]